jgi:hypothetical protein
LGKQVEAAAGQNEAEEVNGLVEQPVSGTETPDPDAPAMENSNGLCPIPRGANSTSGSIKVKDAS